MKIAIIYNLLSSLKEGREQEALADNEVLDISNSIKSTLQAEGHLCEMIMINQIKQIRTLSNFDLVFNLCEGIDGNAHSEADIAAALERLRVPFTGTGSDGLKLCLNKYKSKERLLKKGIIIPAYQIFNTAEEELNPSLQFPIIIKPVSEDASIGIDFDSVVYTQTELVKKVAQVIKKYKQAVIVEEYIEGREINAAVLGNDDTMKVLPLSEIIFDYPAEVPKFLPYEAKWVEDSAFYKKSYGQCPAQLNSTEINLVEEVAKKCFKLCHCKDYARVDFRIKDGIPYVLEINPNPCINPNDSGFIHSIKTEGKDFSYLIKQIVQLTMKRFRLEATPWITSS